MKKKIIIVSFLIVLFGFGISNLVMKDKDFSISERRMLQQFPELTIESLISGRFMDQFENYAQDQFVGREKFRTVKAVSEVYGFQKLDNNGIYVADGYASALEYPLDEESVRRASGKFRQIYETYLQELEGQVFYSVVPDKNYYLAEEQGYPLMDYEKLFSLMQEQNAYMEYIDITDLLDIRDYYSTDTHWRQECLIDVAERILAVMDKWELDDAATSINVLNSQYQEVIASDEFYGIYVGQSALPLQADSLVYLDSDVLRQSVVYNYETRKNGPVYNLELASGKDPYEMFLSGSISLMTIENPNGTTGKELILFRDSFGSSLAPLLMSGYDKITLVDIRYLPANQLKNYIDFNDQDVLFLYSTLVLNNSETLK